MYYIVLYIKTNPFTITATLDYVIRHRKVRNSCWYYNGIITSSSEISPASG